MMFSLASLILMKPFPFFFLILLFPIVLGGGRFSINGMVDVDILKGMC